jgi:hypothetical protein
MVDVNGIVDYRLVGITYPGYPLHYHRYWRNYCVCTVRTSWMQYLLSDYFNN